MSGFLAALGLVFVAELGDKSMLLALAFATRYGWWWLLGAIAAESAVVMALAVLAGSAAGVLLGRTVLELISAAIFIGYGVWTLRPRAARQDVPLRVASARAAIPMLAVTCSSQSSATRRRSRRLRLRAPRAHRGRACGQAPHWE